MRSEEQIRIKLENLKNLKKHIDESAIIIGYHKRFKQLSL